MKRFCVVVGAVVLVGGILFAGLVQGWNSSDLKRSLLSEEINFDSLKVASAGKRLFTSDMWNISVSKVGFGLSNHEERLKLLEQLIVPIDGVCDNSSLRCSAGTLEWKTFTDTCGQFKEWTCKGIFSGRDSSLCQRQNPACPINGSCNISSLSCSPGDIEWIDSTDVCGHTKKWKCKGKYGGGTVSCERQNSACSIDGSCNTSSLSCSAGDIEWIDSTDTCGQTKKWNCKGKHGGITVSCSRSNPACPVEYHCVGQWQNGWKWVGEVAKEKHIVQCDGKWGFDDPTDGSSKCKSCRMRIDGEEPSPEDCGHYACTKDPSSFPELCHKEKKMQYCHGSDESTCKVHSGCSWEPKE